MKYCSSKLPKHFPDFPHFIALELNIFSHLLYICTFQMLLFCIDVDNILFRTPLQNYLRFSLSPMDFQGSKFPLTC